MGGPGVGQTAMGAASGLLGIPAALITGASLCVIVNIGVLLNRSDLRARDLGAEDSPHQSSGHRRRRSHANGDDRSWSRPLGS